MAQRKMADPFGADHRVAAPETPVLFAGVGLTAGLFAIALVLLMPATLVLPSLSLLALVLAGGLALLAWQMRVGRPANRITLWDIAGVCAFIGFAAGMMSQPEHVVELFGVADAAR